MKNTSASKTNALKSASSNGNRLFGFWRDLSLARKLLVAFSTLALLALVVGVVANLGLRGVQNSYESALAEGEAMELISLHMNADQLTARRHEKDFLARWTAEGYEAAYANYIVPHQASVEEIREHIEELSAFAPAVARDLSGSYSQAQYEADLKTLRENIDLYDQSFQKTVRLLEEKGFQDTGLEGEFRVAVHDIEERIYDREGLEPLVITMLQIRRREKDYLLRSDQEYIDNVHQLLAELKRQIASSDGLEPAEKTEMAALTDRYLVAFDALVEKEVETAAATQAFRDAAHNMEPLFEKLAAAGAELSTLNVATAKTNSSRTLLFSSITLAAALLVAVFLSVALSRQITSPVIRLTGAAHELEIGNYEARTEVTSGDELGTLGSAFNTMAGRLKEAFATISKRATELKSVAEIATKASQTTKALDMLQAVVEDTKSSYNLYHSHIYLLDEEKTKLVLTAGAGEPGRQMVNEKRTIALDHQRSLVARAARTNQGAISNDVAREPDFLPNPLLPDTKSEMAIPIAVGDEVLGVLDVQANLVNRFTDEDIAIITTLAQQVGTSLQNVRSYERADIALQEAQSLVDNAPEAIIIIDLESGLFVNPNENAVKLYGLPREDLVKAGPTQMSPPRQPDGRDSTEKAMEKIGEALQGGTPIFEWMHRNGQGEDFLCEIRLVRMPGAHPRVRASVTDITERKRNEDLTRQRAQQQEALNLITQKIQGAVTIESALQVTARELGRALGMKPTLVTLEPDSSNGERKSVS
ncbi:MAG TPA: GAF domain-containing protein [Anaerolineales bacterium]|nr:GAF domain-containing protein [Anaerolineales bacterium]